MYYQRVCASHDTDATAHVTVAYVVLNLWFDLLSLDPSYRNASVANVVDDV